MKFKELRKDLAFLGGMGGAAIGFFFFHFEGSSRFVDAVIAGAQAGVGAMFGSGILMSIGGTILVTSHRDRLLYFAISVVLGAFALFLFTEFSIPPGSEHEFDYTLF
ncbi:MAG: hypothetical protein GY935_14590 [Gammaproteobacteria bacterium]|nr:hypothetical protein [Gammaproteobacteria bacterium]